MIFLKFGVLFVVLVSVKKVYGEGNITLEDAKLGDLCWRLDNQNYCQVKSGDQVYLKAKWIIGGTTKDGLPGIGIEECHLTLACGDKNLATRTILCPITGGNLRIGQPCSINSIPGYSTYDMEPYKVTIPTVKKWTEVDFQIFSIVKWSDGSQDTNKRIYKMKLNIIP